MANIQYDMAISLWQDAKAEIGKVIVGQEYFIDRLLLATAVQGHVLIEGLPGLAKTLTINLLGKVLNTSVSRIQFTPDLLPADITGTMIYHQRDGDFRPHKGPLFANFIIADEINRAPAKVQSALLQAMEERAVVLGNAVFDLPNPFIVMATQNPIEHEGTFELPEAQLDRFLFKLEIDYPTVEQEVEMMKNIDNLNVNMVESKLSLSNLTKVGKMSQQVTVEESILRYIAQIMSSTRSINVSLGMQNKYIEYGASPRASLALLKCARVLALLDRRDYVIPDDIKDVALEVLRHRVVLSFDAIGAGLSINTVINNILNSVNVPK